MLKLRLTGTLTPLDAARMDKLTKRAMEQAMHSIRLILLARLEAVVGTQYETPADMRAKNHPYARQPLDSKKPRGRPTAPSGYLNKQTGSFLDSFLVDIRYNGTGKIVLTLHSDEPERNALLTRGSEKMVGRNFGMKIAEGIDERFADIVEAELGKVIPVRRTK